MLTKNVKKKSVKSWDSKRQKNKRNGKVGLLFMSSSLFNEV